MSSATLYSPYSPWTSFLLPRTATFWLKTKIRPAILMLTALVISPGLAHAQCPAVGADTTCGIVITITNTGATVSPTGQGPYDTIDDTLVGVVNNSNLPITSLVLASSNNIFGFDFDGICGISPITGLPFVPAPPACPYGPTGYEGPGVSFSNISPDTTTGTVTFNPPIPVNNPKAPGANTAYFSLENALGMATACSSIINNALMKQSSGANICATFTPNQGYTLSQAALVCGFANFDWIQQITVQFDPSEFDALNLGGAFDPKFTTPVRLTSKRVPWSDPPQGGGYEPGFGAGIGSPPDFSYPFYYDQTAELPGQENGTVPVACTLAASAGSTLTFHDAPADKCLPGGADTGTGKCDFTSEPKGSFGGYQTHLAGVNFDGTATDLGIGFTWTSTYNGSTGGVAIKKTSLPADGNGTGSTAVTSVSETTTYQGVSVIGVNGAPPGAPATLVSGNACNGVYGGTFNGNVNISAGQNCMFINGYINGNVQANGGSLALSGVLIGGNVQVNGGGTFAIGPSTSINGDLQIQNIPAGTAQNQVCGSTVHGNLQFHNNGTAVGIGSASPSCMGNIIGGNLEVHNNTAPTAIYGNTVGGNLQDQNNTAPTQVFGNAVSNNLQCQNNSSITGGGNKAKQKQGQCTGF